METFGEQLLFLKFKNFFKKFLMFSVALLLSNISSTLSATVDKGVSDFSSGEVSAINIKQSQSSVDVDSEKPLIYISEGVTVFEHNNLNNNIEIVVTSTNRAKNKSPKVEVNTTILLKSRKKAQTAKQYSIKASTKSFYSIPLSDSKMQLSKKSNGSSVFPTVHNLDIYVDVDYAHYYLFQQKQCSVIFISYKSAFFSLQYHHNFSVRPPPFS